MVITPDVKLRYLNSVRSITGCSAVSSQIIKNTKETTATTAMVVMALLANQSSSLPLSSISCNAPTHSNSKHSPTVYMGRRVRGEERCLYSCHEAKPDRRPNAPLIERKRAGQ